MFRNIYITAIAIFMVTVMHGAAFEEANNGKDCQSGKLQISDCFTVETTLVPGAQRYYEPVIVSRLCSSIAIEKFFTRVPTIKSVCGLVEGDDPELTKEAAQLISTSLSSWCPDELIGNACFISSGLRRELLDINLPECMKRITKGDKTHVKKILNTRCCLIVFTNFQGSPETHKIIGDTVIPASVASKFYYIDVPKNSALSEKLAALAKHAATLSVSHEASYLKFNPECYAEFVKQQFGEKTH